MSNISRNKLARQNFDTSFETFENVKHVLNVSIYFQMPKRPKDWKKGSSKDDQDRGRREDRRDERRQEDRRREDRRRDSPRRQQSRSQGRSASSSSTVEARIEYLERELRRQQDLNKSSSASSRSTSKRSRSRSQLRARGSLSRRPRSPEKSSHVRPRRESDPKVTREPKKPKASYKSPERPSFIPEPTAPIKLPKRDNDIGLLKPLYHTNGMERIQTNPVHMSLDGGREFMADVYNFGFVALYTVSEANVLTLCSPSGHVIVYKTGPSLQLALEVRDILFKITDVKKVTFYKAATEKFFSDNGMELIPFVDLYPVAKKNIEEISFGTFEFFKCQLGRDVITKGAFDLNDDAHVRRAAHYARTVAYATWFITARFATRAGLTSSGNVSSFLRYALFVEDADRYRKLIADPYYVPYEEISLTPLDQHNLDLEAPRLASAQRYAFKNYRFKPEHVFDPVVPETACCRSCGLFVDAKSKRPHKCYVKAPCTYPLCKEDKPHSLLTCRAIRAWCSVCQRRGHVDRQHPEDRKFPVCYLWSVFLMFSRWNLATAYVHHGERCQNPYFHQYGLYGLPPSKLPKVEFESGVGKDLPDDMRFKRPAPSAAAPRARMSTLKAAIPRLDKVQTGRVEKKVITIADLNKAVNLTKKISSGSKQGTSGSNLPPNPVVTRLLALVDELRQGGVLPTAQSSNSTKTEAAPDLKVSRRQRKAEAKARRYNEARFDGPCFGYDPTKPQNVKFDKKDSEHSGRVENEELLDMSDDEAPHGETPLNLSADMDLMDFTDDPVPGVVPNPVGALADTVQQVVLNEDSGSRTAPDSKEV
jgi:hypothetical protein